MTEMTLIVAFRLFGVIAAPEFANSTEQRDSNEEAARVLLRAARKIAKQVCRELRVDPEHGDDAVQITLVKMLISGSNRAANMSGGDSSVVAYLRTAVRRNLFEILRKQRRWVSDADPETASEPEPNGNPELSSSVSEAHSQLVDEIIPQLAASKAARASKTLLAGIDALVAIQRGTTTVEKFVRESGKQRSAIDKQFSRIIETLFAEVERLEKSDAIDDMRARVLRVAVEALRPRHNKMQRADDSSQKSDGDSPAV